jgi:hypothetical protein
MPKQRTFAYLIAVEGVKGRTAWFFRQILILTGSHELPGDAAYGAAITGAVLMVSVRFRRQYQEEAAGALAGGCAASRSVGTFKPERCCGQYVANFSRIQRLRYYIVSAEIQDFGPQLFISLARGNYQQRRIRIHLDLTQDTLPVPVLQHTFTENDRYPFLAKLCRGLPAIGNRQYFAR